MATNVTTRHVSVASSTPTSRNNERIIQLNPIDSMFFFLLSFNKVFIFIKDSYQTNINTGSMTSIASAGVPVKFADNLFSVVCRK
jgi:hypothetical protein